MLSCSRPSFSFCQFETCCSGMGLLAKLLLFLFFLLPPGGPLFPREDLKLLPWSLSSSSLGYSSSVETCCLVLNLALDLRPPLSSY